jgi:XTP/dITP diphosphohydrolase
MPELLIATLNRGKFREIADFLRLRRPDLTPLFLGDLDPAWNVVEDGTTFLENAAKKARAAAERFQRVALADDSGLLVDALNGDPGVRSARYAGNDVERILRLLSNLEEIPDPARSARFECVMILATPGDKTATETGTLHGTILREPRGTSGFGFDPVFFLPAEGKTLAELEIGEKNRISHRAQAMERIARHLGDFFPKM